MIYLKNEIIELRAIEPEDLDVIYSWENDSRLWRRGSNVSPFSRFAIKEYLVNSGQDIYENKQLRMMIWLPNSNACVGMIDVYDVDVHNRRCGVGILIDERYRQCGYGSHALQLLVDYVFRFLHFNQLYAYIADDNDPCKQLFSAKGFQLSGTLKRWLYQDDDFVDVGVYQLFNHTPVR